MPDRLTFRVCIESFSGPLAPDGVWQGIAQQGRRLEEWDPGVCCVGLFPVGELWCWGPSTKDHRRHLHWLLKIVPSSCPLGLSKVLVVPSRALLTLILLTPL